MEEIEDVFETRNLNVGFINIDEFEGKLIPRELSTGLIIPYNKLVDIFSQFLKFYEEWPEDRIRRYNYDVMKAFESSRTISQNQSIKENGSRGWIYVLKVEDTYKIGRTIDPNRRLNEISLRLPFEINQICLINVDNMYKAESYLHNIFDHKRVKGEWFTLTNVDIEWLRGLAPNFYDDLTSNTID